jgi:hypothetical protein
MNDPAHAGATRGAEEAAATLDRLGEGHAGVFEADPIGVEEHLAAREGGRERLLVIDQERREADPLAQALARRRAASTERDDLPTAREQRLGDEAAAVGENAGDRSLHDPQIAPSPKSVLRQ